MDKVVTALNGVSGVKYVSEVFQPYDVVPHKNLPACFPVDTDEQHEPFTMGDAGQIQATLTVLVTVYIFDATNNTRKTRTDMIWAINAAMLNDVYLEDLILDIQPVSVQTDQGFIENYSLWTQEFEITYLYDRTTGG